MVYTDLVPRPVIGNNLQPAIYLYRILRFFGSTFSSPNQINPYHATLPQSRTMGMLYQIKQLIWAFSNGNLSLFLYFLGQ